MPPENAGSLCNHHPANPLMDDRFNRNDKPEGQEVQVSQDAQGAPVLLNRIAIDAASSAEARQTLLSTAHSTSAFRHPQVLAVREVRLERDALVFVQEFPEGPLLADTLAQGEKVPMPEALAWMRQFAHALAAAQKADLTLSQICPTEFVVQESAGAPSGLLCLCPPVPAGWWLEVEDPVFASPEQKAGEACDIRSSLYSAGAVLGVMLTGQRPNGDNSWTQVLATAGLPSKVTKALQAVLDPSPAKRCAGPGEWMALLDAAIAPPPAPEKKPAVPAPAPAPAPVREAAPKRPITALAGLSEPALPSWKSEAKPSRSLSPLLAAGAVVILAVVAWILFPSKGPAPVVTPPSAPEVATARPVDPAPAQVVETSSKPSAATNPEPAQALPKATPAPVPAPTETTQPPPQKVEPKPEPKIAAVVPAPPPAPTPAPEAAAKPAAMPAPGVTAPPPPVAAPTPEVPKLQAKVDAPMKPQETPPPAAAPEVPPPPASTAPATPPAPVTTEMKAKPASKEELLQQAAQAADPVRSELYRKVLAMDSSNPKALHGLVEATLASPTIQDAQRDELTRWANHLVASDDPLGDHALGSLAVLEAADSQTPGAAIKTLVPAVAQLKQSLHAGYDGSYPVMLQAYIDLHNAHIKNHEKPKADRVLKALQDEIARTPETIPAKVPGDFAANLEALLKERATKGPPRMQEVFLKTVMQNLYALAAKRGDEPSKKPVKGRR